jgi:hypothetical protein
LAAGGSADPAFSWLYPYDRTVFPRGLLPPELQLGGVAPDGALVHVSLPSLKYKGFFGASNPGRVVLSPAVWQAITLAAQAKDDLKIEVTKISAGQVSGPIAEHWTIAQGSLRGSIYYETYNSKLIEDGGLDPVGIMQIQPGAAQPKVIKSGCSNVCHTASADGSTLVAMGAPAAVVGAADPSQFSSSYDLKNGATVLRTQRDDSFAYGGLYPDGSFLMSASHYRLWNPGSMSRLYDTRTGATIAAPGWDGVIRYAGTTAFSPDGKFLAFIHEDLDEGLGHTLAVMSFTPATKTFSGLVDLASDPNNTLAWPAFTPDSKELVFHVGSNASFETDLGATGDVYRVDLATHTMRRLDALDGYGAGTSQSYLPAQDANLNFAPTVLPEAVGGYFWTVFTSHRSYGNTLPSQAPTECSPSGCDSSDTNGKLWVAAIDLTPAPGADSSHPAFYLDGQELEADNLRGFWVLNPCKPNGSACRSGDDCCGGFCNGDTDGGAGKCGSAGGGCSHTYEKCSTGADCCDSGALCINGRCAQTTPQ